MPRFDLPLSELVDYRPEIAIPADFDDFWRRTLAEARALGGAPIIERASTPLTTVEVYDVTFPGFGGDPIKAWYMVPAGTSGRLPTVVEFNGYGGGRGFPEERLAFVSSGYGYLVIDTRGQGSHWGGGGETADPHGTGPSVSGFMTRGIEDPHDYYYRRVFTDAVRAVDAVRTFDRVDPERVAVCGGSQGGGITLAAGALCDGLVAVMPDVPFLCHFERAVGMTGAEPYGELVRYFSIHRGSEERTFRTLSYFDGTAMATRASAPGLFSVALMDPICPPSTVFAAYNRYAVADKHIEVYPYNEHEGGQGFQWRAQAAFLAARV